MSRASVVEYVQTTASTWRTTLAFELTHDVELRVQILDDGDDPIVDDCWIEPNADRVSPLLDELVQPQLEALGERSEGWPEWLEREWARMQEAA